MRNRKQISEKPTEALKCLAEPSKYVVFDTFNQKLYMFDRKDQIENELAERCDPGDCIVFEFTKAYRPAKKAVVLEEIQSNKIADYFDNEQ